jgi:hypothetical protein
VKKKHTKKSTMQQRAAVSKRHPLFGAMKGTVRIPEGVDLTEPADPEWADRIEKEYDPVQQQPRE